MSPVTVQRVIAKRDAHVRRVRRLRAHTHSTDLNEVHCNTFSRPLSKSKKPDLWTVDDYDQATEQHQDHFEDLQTRQKNQPLRYARAMLTNKNDMGVNRQLEHKMMIACHIGYHNYIDDRNIPWILDDIETVTEGNRAEFRDHYLKIGTDARKDTLKYFEQRISELVKLTPGGLMTWEAAGSQIRTKKFAELFDEIPVAACKLAFPFADMAVDFEGIFAGPSNQERRLWKRVFKTKFVNLAEATYSRRTRFEYLPKTEADADANEKLESSYDNLISTSFMQQLNMPSIDRLPVKGSRSCPAKRGTGPRKFRQSDEEMFVYIAE